MKTRHYIFLAILGYGLYVLSINYPGMLTPVILSRECLETKDVFFIIPKCRYISFFIPVEDLGAIDKTEFIQSFDLILSNSDGTRSFKAEKCFRASGILDVAFLINTHDEKDKYSYVSPGIYYISFVFPSAESIQEEEIKRIRTSLSKAPLAFRVFLSRKELKTWENHLLGMECLLTKTNVCISGMTIGQVTKALTPDKRRLTHWKGFIMLARTFGVQ